MSRIILASAIAVASGCYTLTWVFGVAAARKEVRTEMLREATSAWDALHTGRPQPETEVEFGRVLPVFPGVVWLAADLTADGDGGTCVSATSLVLWYGNGSKIIWRSWDRREEAQHRTAGAALP